MDMFNAFGNPLMGQGMGLDDEMKKQLMMRAMMSGGAQMLMGAGQGMKTGAGLGAGALGMMDATDRMMQQGLTTQRQNAYMKHLGAIEEQAQARTKLAQEAEANQQKYRLESLKASQQHNKAMQELQRGRLGVAQEEQRRQKELEGQLYQTALGGLEGPPTRDQRLNALMYSQPGTAALAARRENPMLFNPMGGFMNGMYGDQSPLNPQPQAPAAVPPLPTDLTQAKKIYGEDKDKQALAQKLMAAQIGANKTVNDAYQLYMVGGPSIWERGRGMSVGGGRLGRADKTELRRTLDELKSAYPQIKDRPTQNRAVELIRALEAQIGP